MYWKRRKVSVPGPSAWVILREPNLGISSPDIFKLINLDKRYDVHTKMCYEALEIEIINNYVKVCLID